MAYGIRWLIGDTAQQRSDRLSLTSIIHPSDLAAVGALSAGVVQPPDRSVILILGSGYDSIPAVGPGGRVPLAPGRMLAGTGRGFVLVRGRWPGRRSGPRPGRCLRPKARRPGFSAAVAGRRAPAAPRHAARGSGVFSARLWRACRRARQA